MLKTEMRNPKTTHIDKMSSMEIAKIMSEENAVAVRAVDAQCENISIAIDKVALAFQNGGRLIYMGAGTSGRLGVSDAAECPPTFGVSQEMVIGIIAGGYERLVTAGEGAEDSGDDGVTDLKKIGINKNDIIVGISAAGGASYVVEGLNYAKYIGCTTIGVTSNLGSCLDKVADISICTDTGAEVVTGSTRLKAGTAQKLVLNMISTGAMIKSGHVYENLMINLKPTNIKLRNRVIGIVTELTGKKPEESEAVLEVCDWNIRRAVELIKEG